MRILQISDGLPPVVLGGSERIAWETSVGLARRGHTVTALTAAPLNLLPSEKEGVILRTITPLSQRFAHFRSVVSRKREREIIRIIHEEKPDIIHAHGIAWQMGYRWIQPSVISGIPCVFTAHGFMHIAYGKVTGDEENLVIKDIKRARYTYNPWRNRYIRKTLAYTTILSVSDALAEYLKRHGYSKVRIVHNGIDLSFWKEIQSQSLARQTLNLPQDACIFLFAGRIGHDKGSNAIIKILPPDAILLIAGTADPQEFSAIRSQVRILGTQNPAQMRLLYAACDAAVVPSVYLDPFPTVCLEAMACSRPVIASSHGGSKEAVLDGKTGFVVDPLDSEAFRGRLAWCKKNKPELKNLGIQARKHMEENFSQDAYLDTLEDIYQQCLANATAKAYRQE